MKIALTIAKRELTALFFSPTAYVVLGIFGMFTVLFFVMGFFMPGEQANLRTLNSPVTFTLLIFIVPAISMRLMSEEFGRGTIESLMTSPLTESQLVLGKYLGGMVFLTLVLSWLLVPLIMLFFTSSPDMGPILCGFLGLFLVGALYLSMGLLASSLAESQIMAFILAIALMAPYILVAILGFVFNLIDIPQWLRDGIMYLSLYRQFDAFNKGAPNLSNLVFFLSNTAMFLFLAVMVVQSKRWR